MPIEYERKFVLENNKTLEDTCSQNCFNSRVDIEQFYLPSPQGTSIRIREEKYLNESWYVYNYKHTIGGDVVELEQAISSSDFKRLKKSSTMSLKKTRYKFTDEYCVWDIDFFKSKGKLYFTMAEAEISETKFGDEKSFKNYIKEYSFDLPIFIKPFLLHSVPYNAKGFSSKKISDVLYAKNLYKDLTDKK